MEKKHNIGKKWRSVFSYTIWMFEYYVNQTYNDMPLDDIDALIMMGLKNIFKLQQGKVKLNNDQLKFFLVMVDYVNKKMLEDIEPPYTKIEMDFFKKSQQFMERFNTSDDIYKEWMASRLELVEIIKY